MGIPGTEIRSYNKGNGARFRDPTDCSNKVPELKKEDATWVPTDWVDHMDLDAMTTFLGDHICNIEEEEYLEAY